MLLGKISEVPASVLSLATVGDACRLVVSEKAGEHLINNHLVFIYQWISRQ